MAFAILEPVTKIGQALDTWFGIGEVFGYRIGLHSLRRREE